MQKSEASLESERAFDYLGGAPGPADDNQLFGMLECALDKIGVAPTEQMQLWTLLGAVLQLGNILFTANKTNEDRAAIEPQAALDAAAAALGVHAEILKRKLLHRVMTSGSRNSTPFEIPLNIQQATYGINIQQATYGNIQQATYGINIQQAT